MGKTAKARSALKKHYAATGVEFKQKILNARIIRIAATSIPPFDAGWNFMRNVRAMI
ncbi:MAG: hypothetical protein HY846_09350 [Nitrosomonadales bacterium]|nr:hypothetical protein [Nitrosomonadales bacterium]